MKKFLNYVEIQTKITSLLTFVLALGFMRIAHLEIKPLPTTLFFLSMLIFDLTTTAINNYIDAKGNGIQTGYTAKQGKLIIYAMFLVATGLGIALVLVSDVIVLVLGGFCFFVGIVYTWGPIPISRLPFGEVISGVMYGYFIPFIVIHASNPNYLLNVTLDGSLVRGTLDIVALWQFLVVFLVPTLLTASIMLANNTCDLDADIAVNRYTLVFYIGRRNAVVLMHGFYVAIYGAIVIAGIFKVMPIITLLTLLSAPIVFKNCAAYANDLVKKVSFKFIIKNFMIVLITYNITVFIGSLF